MKAQRNQRALGKWQGTEKTTGRWGKTTGRWIKRQGTAPCRLGLARTLVKSKSTIFEIQHTSVFWSTYSTVLQFLDDSQTQNYLNYVPFTTLLYSKCELTHTRLHPHGIWFEWTSQICWSYCCMLSWHFQKPSGRTAEQHELALSQYTRPHNMSQGENRLNQ